MTAQLTDKELAQITEVLKGVPSITRAAVFGSRALGTAKNGSDVDLVLFGDIDDNQILYVHMILDEETLLPYFFDVLHYDSITNMNLRSHIDEHGVYIYTKN